MHSDVTIVGGGLVGSAIGFGLTKAGAKVHVLDEGDIALKATRGNFGLTWVQSKGFDFPSYFHLTLNSVDQWEDYANQLFELTGTDIVYRRAGGLKICVGDEEADKHKAFISNFQCKVGEKYDCQFIDRIELQALFPKIKIGEAVSGAGFSRMDGHANPLFLLRALISGIQHYDGTYHRNQKVHRITRNGSGYRVMCDKTSFNSDKVIIAAGLGTADLAKQVDLNIPLRPQRGQLMVTERTEKVIPYPMSGIRQTGEGTIMIGYTNEEVGVNTNTTIDGLGQIANRAISILPFISKLNLVRAWAALRVLTPDKLPVYEESNTYPGVFAMTCHSGVTLAAIHSAIIPDWILGGQRPNELNEFTLKRFHV